MSYSHEMHVSAAPDAAAALGTSRGIAGWWAKSNRLWEEGGEQFLSLDFGRVKKLMRVQVQNSPFVLSWHVLECTLHEWPGTQIRIAVTPAADGGSLVRLEHLGLSANLECFESCAAGWEYFMASLKRYLETGEGTPH